MRDRRRRRRQQARLARDRVRSASRIEPGSGRTAIKRETNSLGAGSDSDEQAGSAKVEGCPRWTFGRQDEPGNCDRRANVDDQLNAPNVVLIGSILGRGRSRLRGRFGRLAWTALTRGYGAKRPAAPEGCVCAVGTIRAATRPSPAHSSTLNRQARGSNCSAALSSSRLTHHRPPTASPRSPRGRSQEAGGDDEDRS